MATANRRSVILDGLGLRTRTRTRRAVMVVVVALAVSATSSSPSITDERGKTILNGSVSASLQAANLLRSRSMRPDLITPAIEQYLDDGIDYLLRVRGADGLWRAYPSNCGSYSCANTALVGLVLLAAGNAPTRGPHASTVSEEHRVTSG